MSTEQATFPSETCPCGDPQPDTERLYCEPCIERMAAEIAGDLEPGVRWEPSESTEEKE